ncbi:MAG: class I SAM-dependent methyltransferase [Myxococcota bacterium]
MSLAEATIKGQPVELLGQAPYACESLHPLVGIEFTLPTRDPWVRGTGDSAHAYLDGARRAWSDLPEYMDFLALDSPIYDLKRAERDLYLAVWRDHLDAPTVLDVGCGVGRMTMPWLDRGATVTAVDPDHQSLRRVVWHAAGRAGRLDVAWASVHALPDVTVDVAIAAEVLCYVPDATAALRSIAERVRPNGHLLLSVEARYGWAACGDASPGSIEAALNDDGTIDLPGDRWVQTYDRERFESLIVDAGLEPMTIVPSHYVPDGPLEHVAPDDLSLEQLLALEARCRQHPIWGPLNRLWVGIARKPSDKAKDG